jgi:hypothetical protein
LRALAPGRIAQVVFVLHPAGTSGQGAVSTAPRGSRLLMSAGNSSEMIALLPPSPRRKTDGHSVPCEQQPERRLRHRPQAEGLQTDQAPWFWELVERFPALGIENRRLTLAAQSSEDHHFV